MRFNLLWFPECNYLTHAISLGLKAGGVRTGIAMHCGCRIFKMAAKVEKFPRLYALYFDRHSSFLRKLSTVT